MTATSKRTALAAFLTLLLLGAGEARAGDFHNITFTFANARPNGETVTAYITNQGRFADVPNGTSQVIDSPFETEGLRWSTGYYDVRITKQAQSTNVYCSYQAVAEYQGMPNWRCTMTLNTQENGARCDGRIAGYTSGPYVCKFEFDAK